MSKWIRENLNKDEGFTLVELMVVVLIIAILIAIAIPTFLGARERAQDRAAQSNLRNALTAAKVHYTDTENYSDGGAVVADVTAAQLTAIEPSLQFTAGAITIPAPAGNPEVGYVVESVVAGDRQIITFTAYSESGKTFGLKDISSGATSGTYYCVDTAAAPDTSFTTAECTLGEW
jgi:type IV pilus assembly protein PilA